MTVIDMQRLHRSIDLCMSESVPFHTHWQYRTTWPLEDLLHDQFFIGARDMLRPGDKIDLVRYDSRDWKEVFEFATVIVLKSGREEKAVPLAMIDGVRILGTIEPPPELEVRPSGSGKHKLVLGNDLIEEFGSKAEAEEAKRKREAVF